MAIERTVVGVFSDRDDAERAIDELRRIGFRDDQMGFAMRGPEGREATTDTEIEKKKGQGAVGGLLAGAGVGGLVAAAAALLIPGVGPVVAGGVLAAALHGAAIGGVAGGFLGSLKSVGIAEDEAHYYISEFNEGRILVLVHADGRYHEVRDVLRRCGAYDTENRRSIAA